MAELIVPGGLGKSGKGKDEETEKKVWGLGDFGGPAYPCRVPGKLKFDPVSGKTGQEELALVGVSVHQYFFAAALTGFCASGNCAVEEVVDDAMWIADEAMVAYAERMGVAPTKKGE